MHVDKKEFMDRIGVGYELGSYETFPCSYYDSESGATCSAEARMDPGGMEMEAEVQLMYDSPPAGKPPMAQFFWIRAASSSSGEWDVLDLKLHGTPPEKEIMRWQEKSCNFFRAVIETLQTDTMPDLEDLIDLHFHRRERLGDQEQGGGGKSPKMNAAQLLNMKKGGGF